MKRSINEKDLLNLSQEQAIEIFNQGKEAVIWALLKLSVMASGGSAKSVDPSKPSSQVPPYEKQASTKKSKKRGRKKRQAQAAPPYRQTKNPQIENVPRVRFSRQLS